MKKRAWVISILVLAFLGLADSAYLAQNAASGAPLQCTIENLSGCNIVATSQYSRLFGVPLATYGVVFYAFLFFLAALELVLVNKLLRRLLQVGALVGVVASLIFVLVQKFLIGAFCIYCFVSAILTVLIFVAASRIEPLRKQGSAEPPEDAALEENEALRAPEAPAALEKRSVRSLEMPPL